jgi:hypothetical protein
MKYSTLPIDAARYLLGIAFIVASSVAFWIALPRDGQVRSFLRNDQFQAYYAVALLISFVFGVVNIVRGLTATIG